DAQTLGVALSSKLTRAKQQLQGDFAQLAPLDSPKQAAKAGEPNIVGSIPGFQYLDEGAQARITRLDQLTELGKLHEQQSDHVMDIEARSNAGKTTPKDSSDMDALEKEFGPELQQVRQDPHAPKGRHQQLQLAIKRRQDRDAL